MIASSAFHQLKSRFRGELIVPGDQQYDAARKVFNVTIDRKPALIARCAIADDVIQALNFARQEKLLVSVRGTGHGRIGARELWGLPVESIDFLCARVTKQKW